MSLPLLWCLWSSASFLLCLSGHFPPPLRQPYMGEMWSYGQLLFWLLLYPHFPPSHRLSTALWIHLLALPLYQLLWPFFPQPLSLWQLLTFAATPLLVCLLLEGAASILERAGQLLFHQTLLFLTFGLPALGLAVSLLGKVAYPSWGYLSPLAALLRLSRGDGTLSWGLLLWGGLAVGFWWYSEWKKHERVTEESSQGGSTS